MDDNEFTEEEQKSIEDFEERERGIISESKTGSDLTNDYARTRKGYKFTKKEMTKLQERLK